LEKKSLRKAFGEFLIEIGEKDERVVALAADLAKSTYTEMFKEKFPERHFEFGIQEQNMMGVAAGLASTGKIPFASTFAVFAAGRAYDQVRLSIAYARFNVKIVATHAGIATGEDGASHQMTEDVALMGAIPGMVVLSASDYYATKSVLQAAYEYDGPVYVRLIRPTAPVIYGDKFPFNIGEIKELKKGKDIALVSYGYTMHEAIKAAEVLEGKGFSVGLYDFLTIKPIKDETVEELKDYRAIVVIEDHVVWGGLGANLSLRMLEAGYTNPFEIVALNDVFGRSGSPEALYRHYGLDHESIVKKAEEILG